MRVDHAFGFACGPGGVAHRRRCAFVFVRPIGRGSRPGDERLILQEAVGHGRRRADDDYDGNVDERVDLVPQREQGFVDEKRAIAGMVHDVGELLRMKPEVEGVEDAAGERHGEIGLEMLRMVPPERGDAIAGSDAEAAQRAGQAARAVGEITEGAALERAIGEPGHDLAAAEQRLATAEDGRQRERVVHHQAGHGHLLWCGWAAIVTEVGNGRASRVSRVSRVGRVGTVYPIWVRVSHILRGNRRSACKTGQKQNASCR